MKKLLLFVPESTIEADLTLLGNLGAVHIIPFKPAKDESINRVYQKIEKMTKAISILEEFEPVASDKQELTEEFHGEVTLMENILKADQKRSELIRQLNMMRECEKWYEEWGNISGRDIRKLSSAGVYVKFYLLSKKEYNSINNRNDIFLDGESGGIYRVALITTKPTDELPFDEVKAPKIRLKYLKEDLKENHHELKKNKELLQSYHVKLDLLKDALDERHRRHSVRTVQHSGHQVDERFSCWKGYLPQESIDEFIETANKNNWGYVLQDPTEEELEEVPTLVKNPKWAASIKPVMNFMGLVPGYNEIDVSKIFMIFFTFFSGILVGDAGYGLIFLLITLFVHYKQKFKPRIEFSLLYTLSGSIMLWGILTGTYFGVEEIAHLPVISSFVIDNIASFSEDDLFIQKFMFIVGAVHLTIGHLQLAWKYRKSVKAISEIGWISIVWGLYLFINEMVLQIPAPDSMIYLFIVGGVLVALFSNPGKNVFKGILTSIANIPLTVINGFSDIISYIRLYAVSLATVLMAISFNEMAIGDGITTVFSGIIAVLILVLGHALNMILAAMAIIVHGVRLNMLEYASHAGVEFAGNEYSPFKLKQENQNNN
ncbi:MAG: V-type ATP synthase subunit I [Bacteroidota bacterium]